MAQHPSYHIGPFDLAFMLDMTTPQLYRHTSQMVIVAPNTTPFRNPSPSLPPTLADPTTTLRATIAHPKAGNKMYLKKQLALRSMLVSFQARSLRLSSGDEALFHSRVSTAHVILSLRIAGRHHKRLTIAWENHSKPSQFLYRCNLD